MLKEDGQSIQAKVISHQINQPELKYKQFQVNNFKIKYSNNCQMLEVQQGEQVKSLTINNHLCSVIGDVLTKVSDIKIGSKIVRITDTFSIADFLNMQLDRSLEKHSKSKNELDQEQFQPQDNLQRKKHIIKKKPYIPGYKQQKPMIYKNTVKNLVRLFFHWLKQSNFIQKGNLLKKLQSLTQQNNYNNQLILLIAGTNKLNQKFLEFIQINAIDSINNSKIIEKQSHINSLQFYKRVFKEQMTKKSMI